MAVSGRKVANSQASLSRGSAEDFDHGCTPCLIEGQHVEASGYCLDCCEYLCNNCFKFHKKTKATRNHQLADKDSVDKHSILTKPADVCTEKCSIHKTEVINFFCPKHKEIGCQDCMATEHRNCNTDYIPNKCAGIGERNEYRKVVKELDQQIKEADAVLKKAAIKDKEIDESHDCAIKDIIKFRNDINNHLDTIQKKIEAATCKKRETVQKELKAVVTSCTNFKSNIKKLQSTLLNSKSTGENGLLFIDIKRAESELQSGEIQQAEISLGKTKTQFTFNNDKTIEETLSAECFGKLIDPQSKRDFNCLQYKSDIKLNEFYTITSCAALSSDKLVLASNAKLLVVNPEKNIVTEEKTFESAPWGIAVLPDDQIAVSIPVKKQICIMTTARKLSSVYDIHVNGQCRCIIYHQNCLYVMCLDKYNIQVLDMEGTIINTILLTEPAVFGNPHCLVLSEDHNLLYVSDFETNTIVSLTLQGEISAVYKHKDLYGNTGMLVLEDGSLLVCSLCNNTIHHVSVDLKQGRKILDCLSGTQSICYSTDRSEVYIGGNDVTISVCSAIYKM